MNMKKFTAFLAVSAMLTGCGQIETENSTDSAIEQQEAVRETFEIQSPQVVTSQPETTTEPETTAETETQPETTVDMARATQPETEAPAVTEPIVMEEVLPETEPVTEPETEPETEPVTEQETYREEIIGAYQLAIENCMDEVYSTHDGSYVYVEYTLYDMDYDSVKELVVKYGTCEADFQTAVYTYRDHMLVQIADGIAGSHVGFAYDYVANQLVLANGHMGYGSMSWYDLDETGNLRFLISTDFTYSIEGNPEYEWYENKYNVANLNYAYYSGSPDSGETVLCTNQNGELVTENYAGFDVTFLEMNV